MVIVPFIGIHRPTGFDELDRLLQLRNLPASWLLLGLLLLASIQWGRGRWAPTRWLRVIQRVVNVIAVIAALVVIPGTVNATTNMIASREWQPSPGVPGLAVDGQRVRNIFAYDAAGNPITSVQLFDQDGQPLNTVGRGPWLDNLDGYFYGGGGPTPVALQIPGRQPVWNVFPLHELSPDTWPAGDPTKDALPPRLPFVQVPPLPASANDAAGIPTPTDATTVEPTVAPAP